MSSHIPAVEVLEFLSDRRFHRSFLLPSNPDIGRHQPHRFSYADFGDPTSNAVVLFCGGLMGARYCYSPLDGLANKYNVRVLHVDRPGIGGSDAIALEKRVQIWLEMVPKLLEHLNIPHVSLASHSGGSIYLLNTLLVYPHLLHPHQPYVCLFAPWVRPAHSRVTLWQVTSQLPAPLIGKFASLAKVVNDNVVPLIGMSGSIMSTSVRPSHPAATTSRSPQTPRSRTSSVVSHEESPELAFDNPEVVKELRKYITSLLFAEPLDGVSADAQLFLNKPRTVPWCSPSMIWSDVDHLVLLLSKILEDDDRLSCHNRTLMIDAFHAESDHMVGEKGRQWFDDCWLPERSSTSSARSNSAEPVQQYSHRTYEYRSEIVQGTDHDFLMEPAFGASEQWLQRVRDSVPRHVEVRAYHEDATPSIYTNSTSRGTSTLRGLTHRVRRRTRSVLSQRPHMRSKVSRRLLVMHLRPSKKGEMIVTELVPAPQV